LCSETRRSPLLQRGQTNASSLSATTDSAPFDYIDEEGASVIALRRRKRDDDSDDEQTKNRLARLISDLTWSMDEPSSTNLVNENNPDHVEIRQVQQQLTIEMPLPQPAHKHKTAYGK
jgi:hypothetical protein